MGLGSKMEHMLSEASHKASEMVGHAMMKLQGRPRVLSPKDDLLALDNTAFLKQGKWTAEFVVSVFDRGDETRSHKIEEEILSLFRVPKGKLEWNRIKYFVAVPRPNVKVDLYQHGESNVFTVGPTQYNGIMSPELAFPLDAQSYSQGDTIVFDVVIPKDFPETHNHTTVFAEETGYGVISGMTVYKRF